MLTPQEKQAIQAQSARKLATINEKRQQALEAAELARLQQEELARAKKFVQLQNEAFAPIKLK